MKKRTGSIERNTKETKIKIDLSLDGGSYNIATGIGFFDHMLEQIARHGDFGLTVEAKGDLHVDSHHTIEDVGIALGKVLNEAIGDFTNIKRYGTALIPMDEALVLCAIDCCNRANISIDSHFNVAKVGDMDTDMVVEFFKAVAFNANINIHILVHRGDNTHHIIEGMFKSFGRALNEAVSVYDKVILSTKGVL
ncbi:MAG: imidazoleglycerol-phosphate dehydratase HisB [Fusobacteriaceae bacterium]|nr:imidazoleglycerol-phosphate dehydratase HisB [Fusobacteriaceae bacterium]